MGVENFTELMPVNYNDCQAVCAVYRIVRNSALRDYCNDITAIAACILGYE